MEAFQGEDKTCLNVEGLLSDLQNLIDDRETADVLFLIGRDEVTMYAHRLILVARCKHFRNRQRELWSSKSLNTQLTVRKPDRRPDVFREVLTFIYTGKVSLKRHLLSGSGEHFIGCMLRTYMNSLSMSVWFFSTYVRSCTNA